MAACLHVRIAHITLAQRSGGLVRISCLLICLCYSPTDIRVLQQLADHEIYLSAYHKPNSKIFFFSASFEALRQTESSGRRDTSFILSSSLACLPFSETTFLLHCLSRCTTRPTDSPSFTIHQNASVLHTLGIRRHLDLSL